MVKKCARWLIILFLSEMLTASAMGYFDDEIAKAVVLALFVPLIISTGNRVIQLWRILDLDRSNCIYLIDFYCFV
jgi:Mg/Co/Ni transporter MgtE